MAFDDEGNAEKLAGCLCIIITYLLIVPVALYKALVLSYAWDWFIANPEHGIPSLTIPQWFGISFVLALLIAKVPKTKDMEGDAVNGMKVLGNFVAYIFAITLSWGCAWIIHLLYS